MSHPKITQTITFTDEFKDSLGLSPSQVKALDELDYEFLKEYTFGISGDYDVKKAKRRYIRSLLLLLDEKQRNGFRDIRRKSAGKQKKRDEEFEEEQLGRTLKKYAVLGLSRTDFLKFREILKEIKRFLHQESIDNIDHNLPRINRQERFIEIAKERLKEFLNDKQLKEFLRIKVEDHEFEINSRLEMVQYQYSSLKLTDEQAREIYQYEENEPTYDENAEYLSEFEKWDIERDFMRSLLDDSQFPEYLKLNEKNKASYINGLKDSNQRKANEVTRYTNRRQYLIKEYLPVKCKWRINAQKLIDDQLEKAIEKIRTDYIKNLVANFERNLRDSIKHYQCYVPNDMAVMQAKAQINCLVPNFICTEQKHRDLIKSLPKRLVDYLSKPNNEIKKADALLHDFTIKNYESTGGTYGGWIHVIRNFENPDDDMGILPNLLLKPTVEENLDIMNRMIEKIDNLEIKTDSFKAE